MAGGIAESRRELFEPAKSRRVFVCRVTKKPGIAAGLIPIASNLFALHEGRKVREEGIGGGKLLRALCDLGVKAMGSWYYLLEQRRDHQCA
jgi:hypothetical protein